LTLWLQHIANISFKKNKGGGAGGGGYQVRIHITGQRDTELNTQNSLYLLTKCVLVTGFASEGKV